MNTIAKDAGVGPGTLYRHFPTREDLIFELYQDEFHQLSEAAAELLEVHEPVTALRAWLDRYAEYAMTKAGLVTALQSVTAHDRFAQEAYGPVTAAIDLLIQANVSAGTIRADVTPDDVLLLIVGLHQIDPSDDWRPKAERLLDFVIAGLRRYH